MDMEYCSVGQRVPEWATGIDGCVMEYQDISGLTLMYFLNNPNKLECQAFDLTQRFRISFTSLWDVGFFCVKVGNLEWSDCAFSPNLYNTPPKFGAVMPDMGYALNLMLIDSATGEIKSIRLIGLGHEFSCQFREWCLSSLQKDISKPQYENTVKLVYDRYITHELVERAWIKWEL